MGNAQIPFIFNSYINEYLFQFVLFQLWLDQNLREMEVLKIIGALIMKKKVKEMQIKSKDISLWYFIRMKLFSRKSIYTLWKVLIWYLFAVRRDKSVFCCSIILLIFLYVYIQNVSVCNTYFLMTEEQLDKFSNSSSLGSSIKDSFSGNSPKTHKSSVL